MTDVIRTVKAIGFGTKFCLGLILLLGYITDSHCYGKLRRRHELLQFGSKCTIPRQGGEIVTECDASKGLMCDGHACICTFPESFAYDPISDECRKKLSKSCRVTHDTYELRELPFHLKCHSTAQCTKVSRSLDLFANLESYWRREMVTEAPHRLEFTMCVCRYGYEPNDKLDGCRTPSPKINIVPLRDPIGYDDDDDEE